MRRYFQWALILSLAFALAVFMAPVGVAHGDDDDEGGDECEGGNLNGECEDEEDEDEGEDDEDEGCGCPDESAEFAVGNFTCEGNIPTLKFNGSQGIGMFELSGAALADPNGCADLGGALESEATSGGCTSAGLVTAPAVALSFTCVGDRDDIVETQGALITSLVSFMPSTPLVMQPTQHIGLGTQSRQGRRR